MLLATVVLDPPTALFVGGILSLVSIKLVRKEGLAEVWRIGQLAGAWGVVYALSVGWHFFFRTDWMFFYALDTSTLPLVPMYVLFVLICAIWGALGGMGVAALVLVNQVKLAWLAFAGAFLGWAYFFVATLDQYQHVGTRAEYLAGTAKHIMDDSQWVMASNVAPAIFGVVGVGILVLQIRRIRALS